MNETWMPIPGQEGRYSVSDLGNVVGHKSGKVLKPYPTGKRGDLKVDLNGHPRLTMYVSRLVLLAFYGPKAGADANHKNGKILDNRLENLEWATRSENLRHSYRVLGRKAIRRIGASNPLAKLTDSAVQAYRLMWERGASIHGITRASGLDRRTVQAMLHRRTWVHVN